jgi:hypothetical protein
MLKENEVVMLILGVGVLFFILLNKVHLTKIYSWRLLVLSYCILLSGWIFTVLEEFFLGTYLNYLEHISYGISSILLIIWCWRSPFVGRGEETP